MSKGAYVNEDGKLVVNMAEAEKLWNVMDIERRDTMRTEMKPDCYGGRSFSELRPRWWGYCEGDKEGDFTVDLKLASDTFPPGTVVIVQEPECPKCHEVPSRSLEKRSFKTENGDTVTEHHWSCGCDFDWRSFALDNYS